jgi:type II restriction enzyme
MTQSAIAKTSNPLITAASPKLYGKKSQLLFDRLKKAGIVGAKGIIKLDLLKTEVKISGKSSVGNLLEEWLGQWMKANKIYCRVGHNSQEFPDFYLNAVDDADLLEVKTFDFTKSPNFDIANFDAYVRSLRTKAYRLDADYLIMGYTLLNGEIKINQIWLKKVWELSCPSGQYAVRTQNKQKKIINIRPYNFKSNSKGFQPFTSRLDFVLAIRKTLEKYSRSSSKADIWFTEVTQNYRKITGGSL